MNAEISMKWKYKGGANSYLNRSYVIGAMKRYCNHILLIIAQFEEPARYVLVNTKLVFMAQRARVMIHLMIRHQRKSRVIGPISVITSVQQLALVKFSVCVYSQSRFSTRNLIRKSSLLPC